MALQSAVAITQRAVPLDIPRHSPSGDICDASVRRHRCDVRDTSRDATFRSSSGRQLQISDVRKQQRRIAALMQSNQTCEFIPNPRVPRVPFRYKYPICVCSRYDPEGKYQNPANGYLRQGIENAKAAKLERRRKQRMDNEDCIHFSDSEACPGSDLISKSHERYVNSSAFRRSHRLSKSYDGVLQRKDIENFGYDELKSKERDKSVKNLVKENGMHNRREKSKLMQAPENTPLPSSHAKRIRVSDDKRSKEPKHSNNKDTRQSKVKNQNILECGPKHSTAELDGDGSYLVAQDEICECSSPTFEKDEEQFGHKGSLGDSGIGTADSSKNGSAKAPLDSSLAKRSRTCTKCGLIAEESSGFESLLYGRSNSEGRTTTSKRDGSFSEMEYLSRKVKAKRENTKLSTSSSISGLSEAFIEDVWRDKIGRAMNDRESSFHTNLSNASGIISVKITRNGTNVSGSQGLSQPSTESLSSQHRNDAIPGSKEPSYLEILGNLDHKFEDGAFDYDVDVSVNDVDTRLRLPTLVESNNPSHGKSTKAHKPIALSVNHPVMRNAASEAYDRALAVAQMDRLPMEPWMYFTRISRPYEFSYFVPTAKYCPDCNGLVKPPETQPDKTSTSGSKKKGKGRKKGKRSEMRHIFGNVDIYDYYPGGKCNPAELLTE